MRVAALRVLVLTAVVGCEGGEPQGTPLSRDWAVYGAGPADPAEDLVPYEIVAPLFSDYAAKHRYIRLPEGGRIEVAADGRWIFPVGTVLVKTFAFARDMRDPALGERTIETRLLVRESETRWRPYVYVWNEDETEAYLAPAGRIVPVSFVDARGETVSFEYRVPSHTQCRNCHGGESPVAPLGPRTAQMDRTVDYGAGPENQIEHLVALGWLAERPPPDVPIVPYDPVIDDPDATFEELDAAARSYLHANCAHCHRDAGAAQQSGLWLNIESRSPDDLGICKITVAGGCSWGRAVIRPGDSRDSVMVCRMQSMRPGEKMPELPSVLAHVEGARLIARWIDAMPADDCGLPPR